MVLVMAIAGQVFADQLILAPTGRTLTLGQAKLEGAVMADDSDNSIVWANVGLPRLELNAIRVENEGNDGDIGFGAEFAILPETLVTPAIGVGIRDITDETNFGPAFYAAVSKTVPLAGKLPVITSLKLHGGLGTDSLDGIFAGVELGLPYNLNGIAEYVNDNFNFSLGWSPIKFVQVKAYWIDSDFFYGGRLSIGL